MPELDFKEQAILLAYDQKEKKVSAVKGADEAGNLQTVPPTDNNSGEFLRINNQDDFLGNFYYNFRQKLKSTDGLRFFRSFPATAEKDSGDIVKAMENPYSQESKEIFKNLKIPSKSYIDEKLIDHDQLAKLNLSVEKFKEWGDWENLKQGLPTKNTHTIEVEGMPIEARFRLRYDGKDRVIAKGDAVKSEIDFSRYYGHIWTPEQKTKMETDGYLGYPIDLTFKSGEDPKRCLVAVDPKTKSIVHMLQSALYVPSTLHGVDLSPQQQADLKAGKRLDVDNMIAADGHKYSCPVQANILMGRLERRFDLKQDLAIGTPEQGYDFQGKAIKGQPLAEDLKASLNAGKIIFMKGLKREDGSLFDSHVYWDRFKRTLKFPSKQNAEKMIADSKVSQKNDETVKQQNVKKQDNKQQNMKRKTSPKI